MTNGLKDIYGNDISLDRTYKPDIGSYWTMQFGIKYYVLSGGIRLQTRRGVISDAPLRRRSLRDQDSAAGSLSSSSPMASRSVSLGNAPVAICGIPGRGVKSSVGTERTPKAAASSCSQSMSTL